MNISLVLDENLLNISCEYLIETISKQNKKNYITGIEFLVLRYDNEVKTYLTKFASLCNNYNYTISFKGAYLDLGIDEHIKFLKMYDNIAKILNKPVTITYTSCLSNDLNGSIHDTITMYLHIMSYITENKLNLDILVENLEYLNRPSVKDIITEIIPSVYGLKFSYNIGHEALIGYTEYKLPENNYITDINDKVKNIYLHDNDSISAHLGFNYGNIDLYEVKDFINLNGYNNSITIELNLYKLNGNTIEEKLSSYMLEVNKVKVIL